MSTEGLATKLFQRLLDEMEECGWIEFWDESPERFEVLRTALREAARRREPNREFDWGADIGKERLPDAGRDAAIEAAHEAANRKANNHTYVSEASIRAAISAYEAHRGGGAAGGWQPIETAPKDGTHFLAYENGRHYDCWAHFDTREGWYWMDHADSEPAPTHWMPLPQPPAIEVKP